MRSLEECKKEIFRRSNERIKARRKKITRTLTWGVSMCLALCAVAVLSERQTNKSTEMPEGMVGGISGDYVQAEILVENDGMESAWKVTDITEVERLFCAVAGLYGGENSAESDKTNGSSDEAAPESTQKGAASCRISFTAKDRSEIVYTLSGNALVNCTANQRMILTDRQLAILKTTLGLSG